MTARPWRPGRCEASRRVNTGSASATCTAQKQLASTPRPRNGVARQNLALVQAAKCSFLGDVITCDGKLHKNVKLQSVDPDGITVELQPEGGAVVLAKLKVENLTGQFKELCGYTAKGATNSSPFSQLDCITARL